MDHTSRDLLTVSLMNIGDKELNDVVCAAYKMGCDQTREVYQKRIEKLEAALDDMAQYVSRADWNYLKDETRKALDGKDGPVG